MSLILYNAIFLFSGVALGSLEHMLPILLAVLLSVFIIKYANKKLSKKQQEATFQILGWLISATVFVFHIYKIFQGNYNLTTDLPLYLCSILALLIPIFTHFIKYWMYEILLFWIIAGTLQEL